ncbi:MAG: biotin/lipoyl-binding protein [Clostridiales bacterium]|jgi:biotin carboxyl carrier protein|nr:biotin/lipoyl-binding protein [Clostridiales bacterium]
MIYVVRINDLEYEVEVERGSATVLRTNEVLSAPIAPVAPVAPQAIAAPQAPKSAKVKANANSINAPMPGTIFDIKVQSGQSVKAGDVLLVFEAMKMENEIMAPADGVVSKVHVVKGASINTGDALVTMQ